MKRGIQLARLQERQVCGLRGIGLKYNRNTIPTPFIFNHVYILMIPLLILTCFANTVCGAEEQSRWSGVVEINEEYFSDDVPKAIPDAGTTTSTLAVTESGTIVDLNVKLDIDHTSDGNLDIYLIAPDGTRVELFTDVGTISDNFKDTIIDNEAALSITEGSAPFTGSYRPEGNLADLYNKDINGTWTLEVTDDWSSDTGTLNSWCLIVKLEVKGPLPSPVIKGESNLPGGICDTISWDDVGEICQFESNVAETVPDEGTLMSTLVINDMGVIEDLNVKVNISHGWDSELDVYLIAPDGSRVELFTDVGGSQDNFIDTILDSQASQSITGGAAPFTGSYRPEGSLDALIGKNIQGTWVLEVTDDSWFDSGTLNYWSLMMDKADVFYYAECATDPDFRNIVSSTGWIIDKSCTFTDLDPDQEYWYRAKARPLKTWSQTSQEDFVTDTLSDTKATSEGDAMLASGGGGGGLGPEVNVIEDPSFELGEGWVPGSNTFVLFFSGMGFFPGELWVSDGDWVAGVIFMEDLWYDKGDIGAFKQTVDWTGVETLVFDYCGILGTDLTLSILIGDIEVWSDDDMSEIMDEHYDETIDVSAFTGRQDLILMVEVKRTGQFTAGVFWDNLRTYGAGGSVPSGSIASPPISLGEDDTWDILAFNATTPAGTELTVDVLPATGSSPITGYRNVRNGTDLSGLKVRTIRLRANLSTSDSEATPVLHDWSVTYTDASCESDWSNVESSLP
jgi:subtilisin-like proprotein convertase family protein